MKTIILLSTYIIVILNSISSFSQWQPDVRLTNNSPAVSYLSYNNARCIAANGNIVHALWYDHRDGFYEIYYKRSTDAGVSWGTDTRLTFDTFESIKPAIAVSGSDVHVAWVDNRDGNYEIYYKRSTNSGLNWSSDTRLTNNSANSQYPSITVTGSEVHLVWQESRDGNDEIYYKRSQMGGASWAPDIRLTNNAAISDYPSVSVSGPLVHVVWYDTRDGNYEIYYKSSSDRGDTWRADARLTVNTALSTSPCVSASASSVYVVWIDYRDGNDEVYFKSSLNEGLIWTLDTRLTNNSALSQYPSIGTSGSNLHIAWHDSRDTNYEIYYKRSTNGGTSWDADTRLTTVIGVSEYPSLCISGSAVHVIWQDRRDTNWEIYYKQNPTGNPIGIKNIGTEIPNEFSLFQNYPNPFNPVTNIRFAIPPYNGSQGDVSLIVYDILGREVATLVNEQLKPGTYEVDWDASDFASGVYYFRLISNEFAETKKMLMIK